ncbi:rhodanese-like domain-containing protein [Gordonia zhaorongruii]|uniref:rhodanese-like domain-containing protein n=1 Tax=Gordonia zhaorongruii TaxID=2597659 RepID=UPI0010467978|nr:rhodanese-like domain-containing protein [Gordonia zhaorongruii]
MTLAVSAPVSAPFVSIPLSLQPHEYRSAVAAGAVPVDLRTAVEHRRSGALLGAVAVESDQALDLLHPGSGQALRGAEADSQWILVSEDGYDAEMLAWHLQARGVRGARFVVGGVRALRYAGIHGSVGDDALGFFDPR